MKDGRERADTGGEQPTEHPAPLTIEADRCPTTRSSLPQARAAGPITLRLQHQKESRRRGTTNSKVSIVGKPHPEPDPGPLLCIMRGKRGCAWAVRSDVSRDLADELDRLAREEPPASDFRDPPVHVERYLSLVERSVDSGPAFAFPAQVPRPDGTAFIDDVRPLDRHFSGWPASEVPHRAPIVAVVEDGYAVSSCFCARRTDEAAEAGLETAPAFRGLGLAPRVAAGGPGLRPRPAAPTSAAPTAVSCRPGAGRR